MKITTKDIITFLPIDSNLKSKLSAELDKSDSPRRLEVVEILWEAYDDLYELQYRKNLEQALAEASDKNEAPSPEFLKQIQDQTRREMHGNIITVVSDTQLSEVRKKLQTLIGDTPNADQTAPTN